MHTSEVTNQQKAGLTADELVTRSNDPRFYHSLDVLPNPDPILRKINKSDQVFDAIGADAQVMSDKRSIRSGLLKYEWRVAPGGDSPADKRAFELCERYMQHRPAPNMRWADVIWNKATAVFRGQRIHELAWERTGNEIMPFRIMDKPNRRFVYNNANELRFLTREEPVKGLEADAFRFLVVRHMPSWDNPYGEAIYSSCFWPYTFKHAGFKYFAKFCEKYGFPWPLGKYPEGTPEKEQEALVEKLARMVEDAVAAVPEGNSVEMLNNQTDGKPVHHPLILLCNTEMSKALTSQTLTTEIQGEGSRAASETHREKEQSVNESDRDMIADSFNELFEWITRINVAGAIPPRFEFYDDAQARKDWVEVFDKSRHYLDIPTAFVHEQLQIPEAQDGEATIPRGNAQTQPGAPAEFAVGQTAEDSEVRNRELSNIAADRADELLQQIPESARTLLDEVDSLAEFQRRLPELYPLSNDNELGEITSLALMTGILDGMDSAEPDDDG